MPIKISRKTGYPVGFPTTPKKLKQVKLTPIKALELAAVKWKWLLNNVGTPKDARLVEETDAIAADTCALCALYDEDEDGDCGKCPLASVSDSKHNDCCNEFFRADTALTAFSMRMVSLFRWQMECDKMYARIQRALVFTRAQNGKAA